MEDFVSSINVGSLSGCLAVVTSLYIQVAILIYQEFKEKPSFNEFAWDKTVLLQRVIKGWRILGSVCLFKWFMSDKIGRVGLVTLWVTIS